MFYITMADKENGGVLFPHVYINGEGERCFNLSPLNTILSKPKPKMCEECGIMEKLNMSDRPYCNCIRYPIQRERER